MIRVSIKQAIDQARESRQAAERKNRRRRRVLAHQHGRLRREKRPQHQHKETDLYRSRKHHRGPDTPNQAQQWKRSGTRPPDVQRVNAHPRRKQFSASGRPPHKPEMDLVLLL
jgi:hypothetical protein